MKLAILLTIIAFIYGCSIEQNQNNAEDNVTKKEESSPAILAEISTAQILTEEEVKKGEIIDKSFRDYVNSLDQIPLPLTYSTYGELPELSKNYDRNWFEKYKHIWTRQPLGLLYRNKFGVVTIDCSIGDYGLVPFIMIYDLKETSWILSILTKRGELIWDMKLFLM